MQGHVVGQEAGLDVMQLLVEAEGAPESLASALAETARALTELRAEVALAPLGSLPNDGVVIENRRPKS
jgi:phenylacetate-CoA ligase